MLKSIFYGLQRHVEIPQRFLAITAIADGAENAVYFAMVN